MLKHLRETHMHAYNNNTTQMVIISNDLLIKCYKWRTSQSKVMPWIKHLERLTGHLPVSDGGHVIL